MLFEPYVRFHISVEFGRVTSVYWETAAHSAYHMFS